jgi:hypothetical protein
MNRWEKLLHGQCLQSRDVQGLISQQALPCQLQGGGWGLEGSVMRGSAKHPGRCLLQAKPKKTHTQHQSTHLRSLFCNGGRDLSLNHFLSAPEDHKATVLLAAGFVSHQHVHKFTITHTFSTTVPLSLDPPRRTPRSHKLFQAFLS